ncbi:hypothetical protein QBC35DRAFT_555658 [Podospora australis]|uniref:CipC-like antibiotic response protein n=1 Tax=Podospora australis TaxID=1536484 RepID=A0AAN6X1S9_9PEZI|nr:hypothetical protein QBC35DRAFT_555658 [Podospora australis]
MGFLDFHESKRARDALYSEGNIPQEHRSKISHELVGGAAAFEAMHLFEKEQRRSGKRVDHAFAKEALAALAGAEADKLFEKRRKSGLLDDSADRDEARRHARRQAEDLYDCQHGGFDDYDPSRDIHETMRF